MAPGMDKTRRFWSSWPRESNRRLKVDRDARSRLQTVRAHAPEAPRVQAVGPTAPERAGRRPNPLRAPSPGAGRAVPPGAAACGRLRAHTEASTGVELPRFIRDEFDASYVQDRLAGNIATPSGRTIAGPRAQWRDAAMDADKPAGGHGRVRQGQRV